MRYPRPPYAERREFHRPFWRALLAEIERIRKRVLVHGISRTNARSAVEGAKTCHQSRLLCASPNPLHSKRRYWTQYAPRRSPSQFGYAREAVQIIRFHRGIPGGFADFAKACCITDGFRMREIFLTYVHRV